MDNFEASVPKRFRIYVPANDIELNNLLLLINKHATIFCEPVEVCTDTYYSVPLRKVTFAVPASFHLTCSIVTKWLVSLNMTDGQVVMNKIEKQKSPRPWGGRLWLCSCEQSTWWSSNSRRARPMHGWVLSQVLAIGGAKRTLRFPEEFSWVRAYIIQRNIVRKHRV